MFPLTPDCIVHRTPTFETQAPLVGACVPETVTVVDPVADIPEADRQVTGNGYVPGVSMDPDLQPLVPSETPAGPRQEVAWVEDQQIS